MNKGKIRRRKPRAGRLDKQRPACAVRALSGVRTVLNNVCHAPLPHAYLRRAPRERYRQGGAARRLVPPHPRPWRAPVHRPARSLRHHPGGCRSRQSGLQGGGERGARARRRAADAGVRRAGVPGGDTAQIPVPRSAPRAPASQHHEARGDHRLDPPPHEGRRLLRVPDADSHGVEPGRRARLPRAVAPASGKILRAAAGAAAVQAADHGRGLRPLFPDRAVLPRRGRARRPLARRVLPARPRDELRHAAGCSRNFPTASR